MFYWIYLTCANLMFNLYCVQATTQKAMIPGPHMEDIDHQVSDCIEVTSSVGTFSFTSNGGSETCALYFIAEPEKIISISILAMNVNCNDGGAVVLMDGWELNGSFLPTESDHPKHLEDRYVEICGKYYRPKSFLLSSQNAAQFMYKLTQKGNYFKILVKHIQNKYPCNVIMQDIHSVTTLRNHKRAQNCSLIALFPARIKFHEIHVGGKLWMLTKKTLVWGTVTDCRDKGSVNYVEVKGSSSFNTDNSKLKETICGFNYFPAKHDYSILCDVTTVRLVSSLNANNAVTVQADLLDVENLDLNDNILMCDQGEPEM